MRSQVSLLRRFGADNTGRTASKLGINTNISLAQQYREARRRGASASLLPTLPGSDAPTVNTVAPSVSGSPTPGETMTSTAGTFTGTPTPSAVKYQWLRNRKPIAGANASTYVVTTEDMGAYISCETYRGNIYADVYARSNSIGPVVSAFNTVPPEITGTPTVGQTLSVTNGTWVGVPTITFTRQWRRDGVAIPGATDTTYILQAADQGKVITVLVTATNPNGTNTALSNATSPVT